jgi:hypothetical protein
MKTPSVVPGILLLMMTTHAAAVKVNKNNILRKFVRVVDAENVDDSTALILTQ